MYKLVIIILCLYATVVESSSCNFTCENNDVIDCDLVCDGYHDCSDNSDEVDCLIQPPSTGCANCHNLTSELQNLTIMDLEKCCKTVCGLTEFVCRGGCTFLFPYNGDDQTKEGPMLKSSGFGDASNAHNFINAQSEVNPRTGTLSFGVTIGYLITYTRRFELKLMYSQTLVNSRRDPFNLGLGWHLNLPFTQNVQGGRFLQMSDGSRFLVLKGSVHEPLLRYYDTDDVHITQDGDYNLNILRNGDRYIIDQYSGIVKTIVTREGFRLDFKNIRYGFQIRNETDVIFTMSYRPDLHGRVLKMPISYGLINVETVTNPDYQLSKIICHSCNGPNKTYTIAYNRSMVKRIHYPSGLKEKIRYKPIGKPNPNRAKVVSKFVRIPGYNSAFPHKRTPNQVVTYDYNPDLDGHDYTGSPYIPMNRRNDTLLAYDGTYYYRVKMKHGDTCTKNTYDKMHLLRKTKITNCSTIPEPTLKETLYEYPCPSNLPYAKMQAECPRGVKHYMFPSKVTNIFYGYNKLKYQEITEKHYDNYGLMVYSKQPNGQRKTTLYQDAKGQKGVYRGTISEKIFPAEGSPYPEFFMLFDYKDIPKFNNRSLTYSVVVAEKDMIIIGEPKLIRQTSRTYYTNIVPDVNNLINWNFGRVKREVLKGSDEEGEELITTYKYKAERGRFQATLCISATSEKQKMHSSETTDIVTGLVLEKRNVDQTKEKFEYNLEGKLTKEITQSTDGKKEITIKKMSYHTKPNENFYKVTALGGNGRIEKYYTDHAGNVVRRDIYNKTKEQNVITETYNYDNHWRLVAKNVYYQFQAPFKAMETKYKYDVLDRQTEITLPTGVAEANEYYPTTNGMITKTYLLTNRNSTIPTCKVELNGNVIRSGVLRDQIYNVINSPCNINDTLWVEQYTYDGFARLESTIKLAINEHNVTIKSAMETIKHNDEGFLISKTVTDEHKNILLNSHYEYNMVFKKMVKIFVKTEEGIKIIATAKLDGFGRIISQDYEGVTTKYTINNYDQLKTVTFGNPSKAVHIKNSFDTFGRKKYSSGYPGKKSGQKEIFWNFYDDGRQKDIKTEITVLSAPLVKVHIIKHFVYEPSLGDVSSFTLENDAKNMTITKTYDHIGRIIYETDFVGYFVEYSYNKFGQLTSVSHEKDKKQVKMTITYDYWGRLFNYNFVNGKNKQLYGTILWYDKYGRINTIEFKNDDKLTGKIHYTYNELCQLIKEEKYGAMRSEKPDMTEHYAYDYVGRIKSYQCNQENNQHKKWECPRFTDGIKNSIKDSYIKHANYSYDIYNNIKQVKTVSSKGEQVTVDYVYYMDTNPTVVEQLTISRKNMDNLSKEVNLVFHYDSRGNVKRISERSGRNHYQFDYDGMNVAYDQMMRSNEKNIIITKCHDEAGNLFFKMVSNNPVGEQFFHDHQNTLRSQQFFNNSKQASFAYIAGRKVGLLSEDGLDYYYLNIAGSVVGSVKNGAASTFSYTPFGCNLRNTSSNPIGFQNMYTGEDGIIVAENGRLYAPWLGRFLQRDPIGPFNEGSGIQGYSFADNSPLLGGDPSGEVFQLANIWNTVMNSFRSAGRAFVGRLASIRSGVRMRAANLVSSFSRSQNLVPVSSIDLPAGDLDKFGGGCGSYALCAAVQYYEPGKMIDPAKLVQTGDKYIFEKEYSYYNMRHMQKAFNKIGLEGYEFKYDTRFKYKPKFPGDVPHAPDLSRFMASENARTALIGMKSPLTVFTGQIIRGTGRIRQVTMNSGHMMHVERLRGGQLVIQYDTMELPFDYYFKPEYANKYGLTYMGGYTAVAIGPKG